MGGAHAAIAALIALRAAVPAVGGGPPPAQVRVRTTAGAFTIEFDSAGAPNTVSRFLARAGGAAYDGLELCESRAHGFLVFGCLPFDPAEGAAPRAPGLEPPQEDEIDAAAMGLGERRIEPVPERDWLWQREIFPRFWSLEAAGREVPAGLQALVDSVKRDGTKAMARLDGTSRLAYLEAIGYRFTPGASASRLTRGALATAAFWPGEADERFLLALTDLPERDGRATVFGRVVDGWDAIDAIAAIPVDKSHRPRRPVTILGMELVR